MARSFRAALALAMLGLGACASTERSDEPRPVLDLPGFSLPQAPGERPLPASFVGIVVTPDGMKGLPAPGAPLRYVLTGSSFEQPIPELYDHLLEARDRAGEDAPLVWFVRPDVELTTVAAALATGVRTGVERQWLASGPLTSPTMRAIEAPPFGAPGRNDRPSGYSADLRVEVHPDVLRAFAEPRAQGDRPGFPVLDARFGPPDVPLAVAPGTCATSTPSRLHRAGEALCDELGEPYALTLDADLGIGVPRLLARLADDPRPDRCIAGPPRLSFGAGDPAPACEGVRPIAGLADHFAAQARRQHEAWVRGGLGAEGGMRPPLPPD